MIHIGECESVIEIERERERERSIVTDKENNLHVRDNKANYIVIENCEGVPHIVASHSSL